MCFCSIELVANHRHVCWACEHNGQSESFKSEVSCIVYMLPLSQIMRKNQIAYHSYADDTQMHLALSPNDYSPIDSLCQCTDQINSWMCQNCLQLNKKKTEVIVFGNKDEVLKVNAYLDSRGQTTKHQVRNLGVILETDLSFSSHVKAVTKSAYYHLKNIARIRCFVSSQDLEKLVHHQQSGLL